MSPAVKLFGSLGVIAGGANVIGSAFWGYPIVYCIASPHFIPVFRVTAVFLLYITAGYLVYALAVGRMVYAFWSAIILVGIIELPKAAHYLFSMGGSCE